ncbi:hypothetical protein P154DRAFT_577782 [Amniculicola lignicola CBS 123094]|uniref:Tat pathway signal sequence n=1 Tax=Amniculicola lignicola CBS 123094 TaxID=1392246 RepID=A0A6A5WHP1_9PLEO|nr:hypothetical protein P154DRAFT_577782 [Amniculicola lignicola CBS 123094]
MDFWNRSTTKHQPITDGVITDGPTKRISTPAGQRLSVILENGDTAQSKAARDSHRISTRKTALASMGDVPRESMEDQSHTSSGYSFNVWSDGEKFSVLRNHKQVAKRGGWKRLVIIIGIIIACIVALAVGLAMGLKKKSSSKSTDDPASTAAAAAASQSGTAAPTPTATGIFAPSALPSNFPVGSYSMVTFLDTIQANCTANPSTWTCYPYTIYNDDKGKSVATFNWIIASPSAGKFTISSTDNPFSISFKNTALELLDAGQTTERYRFQMSQTKKVSPAASITDDDAAVECQYANTNLQAYLYTKMARSFPDTNIGEPSGDPSFPVWPFAVRVEQAVGGGENVPTCYKLNNGQPGDRVTDGLQAQDQGSLCSCLYKNWRTPT